MTIFFSFVWMHVCNLFEHDSFTVSNNGNISCFTEKQRKINDILPGKKDDDIFQQVGIWTKCNVALH